MPYQNSYLLNEKSHTKYKISTTILFESFLTTHSMLYFTNLNLQSCQFIEIKGTERNFFTALLA